MPARRRVSKPYSSYKRTKRYKRFKRLVRVFTLSLTGFFLLGVSYYIYVLAINIQKPFAQASAGLDYGSISYNSTTPINIVFVRFDSVGSLDSQVEKLYVLNVNPVESKSYLVKIPLDFNIENYKGMGTIPFSKVYSLNSTNSSTDGARALFKAVETTLAIKINGYVLYDNQTVSGLESAGIFVGPENLPTNLSYASYLKIKDLFSISHNTVQSDLNTLEILKIISDVKESKNNFKFTELGVEGLTSVFDKTWVENTNYESVRKERDTITILNSTSKPGLATWASRYINNLGGVITELGNSGTLYAKNEIYSNLPADNFTLSYLKSYFNVSVIKTSDEYSENTFLANRSDILLVLGEQAVVELY